MFFTKDYKKNKKLSDLKRIKNVDLMTFFFSFSSNDFKEVIFMHARFDCIFKFLRNNLKANPRVIFKLKFVQLFE